MNTNELIFGDNNIKELFLTDRVDEILITTDAEAFNMTEGFDSIKMMDDLDWSVVIDFGLKNIICEFQSFQFHKVAFADVTAVCVRWNDCDDVETIINKNGSWGQRVL